MHVKQRRHFLRRHFVASHPRMHRCSGALATPMWCLISFRIQSFHVLPLLALLVQITSCAQRFHRWFLIHPLMPLLKMSSPVPTNFMKSIARPTRRTTRSMQSLKVQPCVEQIRSSSWSQALECLATEKINRLHALPASSISMQST